MRLTIAAITCFFRGHVRGKFTGLTKDAQDRIILRSFKCPRCEATWSRKSRAQEAIPQ